MSNYPKPRDEIDIIIVEDDKDIQWLYEYHLSDLGFNVDIANTGEIAIEKVENKSYDIAIIDYMLPGIKGDEVAVKMRKIIPDLHVLFISGFTDFVSKIMLEESFYTVLLKPVDVDSIVKAVERLINAHEIQNHSFQSQDTVISS